MEPTGCADEAAPPCFSLKEDPITTVGSTSSESAELSVGCGTISIRMDVVPVVSVEEVYGGKCGVCDSCNATCC